MKVKCPNCGKEISQVNVISECWQKATLQGNKIIDYGKVEEVLDTVKIECRECYADIQENIKE